MMNIDAMIDLYVNQFHISRDRAHRQLTNDLLDNFFDHEQNAFAHWPTQAGAAMLAGVHPGTISRNVKSGVIKTDSPCFQERVDPASLMKYINDREQCELQADDRRMRSPPS